MASSTRVAETFMDAFKAPPLSVNPSASKITLANVIGNSDPKALQISTRHQYQLKLMHFAQVGV